MSTGLAVSGEAGHILRHGEKELFIEDNVASDKEKEVDEFSGGEPAYRRGLPTQVG